jgi:outer membrane protein, heavy metal efflux system
MHLARACAARHNLGMWAVLLSVVLASDGFAYVPTPDAGLYRLANTLKDRDVEVLQARSDVSEAEARLHQSLLFLNPDLSLSVGNIPVGATNPPGLRPFDQSLNYDIGVSQKLEINKRAHRQERDRHALNAAKAQFAGRLRERAVDLARVLGDLAAAQLRADIALTLRKGAEASLEINTKRTQQGFSTPLEADRLQLEVFRLDQQRSDELASQQVALSECARILAVRCAPFATVEDARKFAEGWIDGTLEGTSLGGKSVEQRWDIKALEQNVRSHQSALSLANAYAWPDPTIGVQYVHDRFTIAGNNPNIFNVYLSFPLTLFDHGQAEAQEANARVERDQQTKVRLLVSSKERVEHLKEALTLQHKRKTTIATDMLPRARAAVQNLEKAVGAGALPLIDLLQARRSFSELLLAEADSIRDALSAKLDLLLELGENTKE